MARPSFIFICNTPIQLLLAQVYVKTSNITADLIHTFKTATELAYFDKDIWSDVLYVECFSPQRNDYIALTAYRLKTVYRLLAGFPETEYKAYFMHVYSSVYIFNDCDITNQTLLKKLQFYKLVFLDDGIGAVFGEFFLGSDNNCNSSAKGPFHRLFDLHVCGYLSFSKDIDEIHIFNKHLSVRKDYAIEMNDLLRNGYGYLSQLSDGVFLDYNGSPDYVILTQPLSEQGFCKNYEEVAVLDEFIRSLPKNAKILFKVHPSEETQKYESITKHYNIVQLSGSKYVPYELYHFKLKPKHIVSFFTASLITSQLFYKSKTISLIKRINVQDHDRYIEFLSMLSADDMEFA